MTQFSGYHGTAYPNQTWMICPGTHFRGLLGLGYLGNKRVGVDCYNFDGIHGPVWLYYMLGIHLWLSRGPKIMKKGQKRTLKIFFGMGVLQKWQKPP